MSNIGNFDIRTHIIDSLVETFDTKISMKIEVSDSEPPDTAGRSRMVAAVNFSGNIVGMINIQVTSDLARLMLAKSLDIEPEKIEDDGQIKDMLAEISQIVGGNLKSALNDAGHACDMAAPSLTNSDDFSTNSLNMDQFERYIFNYQEELILVEVDLKSQPINGDGDDLGSTDVLDRPKQIDGESVGDVETEDNTSEEVVAAAPNADKEVQEAAATQSTAETPLQSKPLYQPTAAQTPDPLLTASPAQAAIPRSPQSKGKKSPEDFYLDLLLDIPLEIKVELGRTRIQIQELLNLSPGSAVKLVKLEGEPVDILANDTLIARGEVVIQQEKYGIRVTEITSRMDRIKSFSF